MTMAGPHTIEDQRLMLRLRAARAEQQRKARRRESLSVLAALGVCLVIMITVLCILYALTNNQKADKINGALWDYCASTYVQQNEADSIPGCTAWAQAIERGQTGRQTADYCYTLFQTTLKKTDFGDCMHERGFDPVSVGSS